MAGAYPDVPGYRFAYDKDGTSLVSFVNTSTGTISVVPQSVVSNVMGTRNVDSLRISSATLNGSPKMTALLFPEARTISGYFMCSSSSSGGSIQVSDDTISGIDGTWNTVTPQYTATAITSYGYPIGNIYRNNIQLVNWPSITAIRITFGNNAIYALHLYGSIATSESPDRLRIVDMSGNDIAAQLDFGDIRQRNNVTKQFKVVNNSSTKTANNITVTFDTNPDASPTLIGQYQLSTDNTAFANAINIGNLNPGQSSPTLYLRDTIASNAQLGPWTIRLTASANTWS